jgi:transcriptional regulator with XRE-family HTH domain
VNDTTIGGMTLAAVLKGYNQAEVARHVGVTKTRVNRWARGESFPEVRDLPKLAEILRMTVTQLTAVIAGSSAEVGRAS